MTARQLKFAVVSIMLIVLQTQVMRLISLEGITPDLLTIWIVYLAVNLGQANGMLWGFGIGLALDLVTGNFIGLSALTKTIAGFTAGFFYNENKIVMTLSSYRFVLSVLIVSLIHNTVYFILFTQGTEIGLLRAFFQFGIATTLYTSTITLLPMFVIARKSAS